MALQSPSSHHRRLKSPAHVLTVEALAYQLISPPAAARALEPGRKDDDEPTTTHTLSVKRTTTVTLKPTGTGVPPGQGGDGSTLLGCYAHPSTQSRGGALGAGVVHVSLVGSAVQQFKVPDCLAKCAGGGHQFVAIEGGDSCFCASGLASDAVQVNDLYCDIPCLGDNRISCGGADFSAVYSLRKPQSTTSADRTRIGALDISSASASASASASSSLPPLPSGAVTIGAKESEGIGHAKGRGSSSPALSVLLTVFSVFCFLPLFFFLCITYRRRVAMAKNRGHHHRRINSITLEPHPTQNQPRRPVGRGQFGDVSSPKKAHAVLGIDTGPPASAFRRRHSAPLPPEDMLASGRRASLQSGDDDDDDDVPRRSRDLTAGHHASQPHPRRPSELRYKEDGIRPRPRPAPQSLPETPQTSLPGLPPLFDWNIEPCLIPPKTYERALSPPPSSSSPPAEHRLSRPTAPLTPLGNNPFVAPSVSRQEYKVWRPTGGAQDDDVAQPDNGAEGGDRASMEEAVIFFMPEWKDTESAVSAMLQPQSPDHAS